MLFLRVIVWLGKGTVTFCRVLYNSRSRQQTFWHNTHFTLVCLFPLSLSNSCQKSHPTLAKGGFSPDKKKVFARTFENNFTGLFVLLLYREKSPKKLQKCAKNRKFHSQVYKKKN